MSDLRDLYYLLCMYDCIINVLKRHEPHTQIINIIVEVCKQ